MLAILCTTIRGRLTLRLAVQAHVELLDQRIAALQAQVAERAAQAPAGPAEQAEAPHSSHADSSPSVLSAGVASTAVVGRA